MKREDEYKTLQNVAYMNIISEIEALNIVKSEHFNIKLIDEDNDKEEKWLSDYGDEDTFRDIQDRIKGIIERDIISSKRVYEQTCEDLGHKAILPYGYPEELK